MQALLAGATNLGPPVFLVPPDPILNLTVGQPSKYLFSDIGDPDKLDTWSFEVTSGSAQGFLELVLEPDGHFSLRMDPQEVGKYDIEVILSDNRVVG